MVQLDDDVIDAQADKRTQQVLDRLDRALLQRKARRILNAPQVGDDGWDFEPPEVGPPEANSVICRSRLQG